MLEFITMPVPEQADVYMIKYKVYQEDKLVQVSYSQIHDEFLNKKHNYTVNDRINQDIKFYRNSMLGKAKIDIFVNTELHRTVNI